MLADRASELERRALLHAALADPARLAITDTLLAGDASPSEQCRTGYLDIPGMKGRVSG